MDSGKTTNNGKVTKNRKLTDSGKTTDSGKVTKNRKLMDSRKTTDSGKEQTCGAKRNRT